MKATIRFAKIFSFIIFCSCIASCKRPSAESVAQEAGDVLNPDGRHREARVAGQASAAAESATTTAIAANKIAQDNLKAATEAQAAAAKTVIEAKAAEAKAGAAKDAAEAAAKQVANRTPSETAPAPAPK